MNCFYRIFYKFFLLVFLLWCLGLQIAEACITPKPMILGNDTACENSVEFYRLSNPLYGYKINIKTSENSNKTFNSGEYYSEIEWNKPGIGFVRFTYTDKSGCTDSVTKQIFVKPSSFQFDAGPDVNVCQGDSVTIGLPALHGFTYRWNHALDFVDNHPFFVTPYTTMANFIFKPRDKYSTYFKIVATDTITGCRYVDTVWVKVNPRFKSNITGETGCLNDSTTYIYTTASLPYNARWEIEGGEILSDNKSRSVQVKWNRIGKNKLILKYFTGDCKDSTVIETALSAVKQPFYAGPDLVVCDRDSVILGMPPIPNCSYVWFDTRYIHLGLPDTRESYYKKQAISITKGDFVILYQVTVLDNLTGCKFIDTVKLTIKPRLKTNITGTVGCYNQLAAFTTDTLPAYAYWFAEGGEIISDNKAKSVLVRWNRNGTNIIKLRYNHKGCTDFAMFTADIDSLTYFPITGADSIFENTVHTYTVEKLGKTVNKWHVTGGEIISETENAITIQWKNTNSEAKIWSYKINDKGCFSDTSLLPIVIKKRENLDLSHTFHVYPNPFLNNIMISPIDDFTGDIIIILSDMLGRKLIEQTAYITMAKNALNLNVSAAGLKSGFYNISIIYPQGKYTWKLVRE